MMKYFYILIAIQFGAGFDSKFIVAHKRDISNVSGFIFEHNILRSVSKKI